MLFMIAIIKKTFDKNRVAKPLIIFVICCHFKNIFAKNFIYNFESLAINVLKHD